MVELGRVDTWRIRGCLPAAVEVTASFVKIQQTDSYFSGDSSPGAVGSDDILLSMLYSTAITRLVNGMIEKTRDRQKLSIAVAAELIDMPRTLIDLRHGGSLTKRLKVLVFFGGHLLFRKMSHAMLGYQEPPSLNVLRPASGLALDWLKSYYWERQKNAIPYQSVMSADVRKEIKSRLRELAYCLKLKHSSGSCSSQVKAKRRFPGSKKQMTKVLKKRVRLYSFFSSDVVSVLLKFLLKPSNSADVVDPLENFQIKASLEVVHAAFDECKPVITKFSKIEPDVLLSLLKTLLDMIQTRTVSRDDFGNENFSLSKYDLENQAIGVLSSLFASLVLVLKDLKLSVNESQGRDTESDCCIPRKSLTELIRRCLQASVGPENHELLSSALLISRMVGNCRMTERIEKLSSLYSKHSEDDLSDTTAKELSDLDKYIHLAAQKFETLKLRKCGNSNISITDDSNAEDGNIWSVATSWNPCPIGMLPRAVGLSGYVPDLDYSEERETKIPLPSTDDNENTERTHCNKRDANSDIEREDESSIKRMRVTEDSALCIPDDTNEDSISDGVKGRLLINGAYERVCDPDVKNILSRLRVLVTTKST